MTPVVSIVGKSDSGKTTFLEKLIPELRKRGYRIATVKHDVHGFDMDREGKDSWRHRQAGAHTTIVSSPQKLALIRDMEADATLAEIRDRFISDVDIIISEGYKNDSMPKVEIYRTDVHSKPLCGMGDNLIAMVTDAGIDPGVPCFTLDDVSGVADLLEAKFLMGRGG